jgi:rhodanese-related sulfurtransferase
VVEDLSNQQLALLAAEGVPLIDIRRPLEWDDTGVIDGSHRLAFFDNRNNYDLDLWLEGFDKVADRKKPFILICGHGVRTGNLGHYLDGRPDFGRVLHLKHGIAGWIEAGRPVIETPGD